MSSLRGRAVWLGLVLLLALPLLLLVATAYSETGFFGLSDAVRVILGLDVPGDMRDIMKLRLLRAICAIGVGGGLALAGALAQGVFRNPMAEPGLLGVSSGAAVGAFIGIAILGGYGWGGPGPGGALSSATSLALIPTLAFAGALATAFTIYRFATRHGRISIAVLLLTGLAVNSLLGSILAALQVLLLQDFQVSRAFLAWGFGSLDDKSWLDALVVWCGALLALASIPFVGLELDLLSGGEEDAAALGADPQRIKAIALVCMAVATATAVAVSGPVAFVGLLVPQVVRLVVGPHHRVLLPMSFLAGAFLVLTVIVLQHAVSPALASYCQHAGCGRLGTALGRFTAMQPGVLTSLIGAPFFLYLLLKQGRLT